MDRSVTGQLLPLEKVTRDENGQITLVEFAYQNAGSRKARGADLGLTYQLETQFGTFTSITQATYLDSLQFAQVSNTPEIELRSTSFGSDTSPLKWKATSTLDYAWRGFSTGVTAYYLDGFHEILATTRDTGIPFPNGIKEHYVSETWLFDVRASYSFHSAKRSAAAPVALDGKEVASIRANEATTAPLWNRFLHGTTITLGCNNVFGHDPPTSATGVNYPANLYDPTGRFVYLSVTKKFF